MAYGTCEALPMPAYARKAEAGDKEAEVSLTFVV